MRNRAYAWDINFTIKLAWSIESMCGDQNKLSSEPLPTGWSFLALR